MLWLVGVIVTLAWGAAAFGGNYPWAYTPLLIASAVLGVSGLALGRRRSGPPCAVALFLASIGVAAAVQMVPIPASQLAKLSPQAIVIVRQQSLAFSVDGASHALSIDPSRTLLGLEFFVAFSVLLIGTARWLTREHAKRLAAWLIILGVALATMGIIQRATFNGKIYGFWVLVQGGSPFGPFVNRNHFAGWMLMALPVALGYFLALVSRGMQGRPPGLRNLVLWFSTEHASRTLLTGFSIIIMMLALVLTLSRSGITALAGALVIAGAVMTRRQTAGSRRALMLAYLVCLIIIVVSAVGWDEISSRFAERNMDTVGGRLAIWADTIRIARDFWLTGTGLNTYGISTLYYQTPGLGSHLREAHSDYLQLAAEGGLLLALPIIGSILAFVCAVRRRLAEDTGSIWWIRMGAVTGLLAIAFQSLGEFSLQMPGNAALFAVVGGIALHDSNQ